GTVLRAVDHLRQRAVEDVVHERGLAGAGYAGDRGERPQRDLHRHVFEVVLGRVVDRQRLPAAAAAIGRHRDPPRAREVLPREGLLVGDDLVRGADGDQVAAELAGAGGEVEDVVGRPDRVLVVLDD